MDLAKDQESVARFKLSYSNGRVVLLTVTLVLFIITVLENDFKTSLLQFDFR